MHFPQGEQPVDFEHFAGLIKAGQGHNHEMMLDHAFEIRSVDMEFRAKVAIFANHHADMDTINYPYAIYFKNLMLETDSAGNPKQMELKHSSSGYLWLEAGHHDVQMTGPHHPFEIRNRDKVLMATVQIGDNEQEL